MKAVASADRNPEELRDDTHWKGEGVIADQIDLSSSAQAVKSVW